MGDLDAAVRYALKNGANNIILLGYSMGGAIALNFLLHSSRSEKVSAIVLDSPVVSAESLVHYGLLNEGRPKWVAPLLFPGVRAGLATVAQVPWNQLNLLDCARSMSQPLLLFHCEADPVVPIKTSRQLVSDWRGEVTPVWLPGGGHVKGWNYFPDRYEEALREFLSTYAE